MWDINEIKSEHYESNRDKPIIAIVEEAGEFGVYQQTKDSVAPYFKYPNARKAAARVLQLLGIGPVAPQDYPEEVCIGEIEYASAEVLPFAPVDDKEQVLRLIRSTLDAPTFIDPAANCRNLTKTLMEIERVLNRTREPDNA